jgi:hypothetical protein
LLEWLSSRTQITTNINDDAGEIEPSYTAGENLNQYNHCIIQYGGSLKT